MQLEEGDLINESNFTPYSCRSPDSTRLTGWLSSCLWVQWGLKFTWNQKAWMQTNYAVGSRMAWKVWQNWTSLMTQPVNSCLAGCDLTTQVNKLKRKRILTKSSSTNLSLSSLRSSYGPPLREWKFPLRCRWPPCLSLSPPPRLICRAWWWWGPSRPLCAPCQLGVSFHPGPLPIPPDSPSQHQSLQSHASTEMGAATHHLKRKGTSITKGETRTRLTLPAKEVRCIFLYLQVLLVGHCWKSHRKNCACGGLLPAGCLRGESALHASQGGQQGTKNHRLKLNRQLQL